MSTSYVAQNNTLQLHLKQNGILHIALNRPAQLNALSHELLADLSTILTEAKTDASVRAILLTGEGKGFCAGANIKELVPLKALDGEHFARFGQDVFNQFETLGKPSLAAIHGFAFGGGCELAMATTLRIAASQTKFGQPEIKLGVIPGFGGTQRLARLIGMGRALAICLSGDSFTAEQALEWGLVTEVCAPENLISRAEEMLTTIVQYSAPALASIMSVIYRGYNLPLAEALAIEAEDFGICCNTDNKHEGVAAFLEKRTAKFA